MSRGGSIGLQVQAQKSQGHDPLQGGSLSAVTVFFCTDLLCSAEIQPKLRTNTKVLDHILHDFYILFLCSSNVE